MSGEESITSELDVLHVVRACYDFEASSDDELSIREGDIISVTKVLDGWSVGKLSFLCFCLYLQYTFEQVLTMKNFFQE